MSHANNKLMEKIGMRWGLLPLYALIYLVGMCFKKEKREKEKKVVKPSYILFKSNIVCPYACYFYIYFFNKKIQLNFHN